MKTPWMLAQADRLIFGEGAAPASRYAVLGRVLPYVARELAAGVPLGNMSRHILGLFQGQPGARAWRRHISENAHQRGAGLEVLTAALPPQREAGGNPPNLA